ncbi:unnamed protein product [Ascophyllum nodosum]
MPRFNATNLGRTRPPSPRSDGSPHATGSPRAAKVVSGTTTRGRGGGTPNSSPRNFPQPPPRVTESGSFPDLHRLYGRGSNSSAPNSPASVGKPRKGTNGDIIGEGGGAQDGSRTDSGRIRVAVRVRPFLEKEKQSGARCVINMSGTQTKILDPSFFEKDTALSSSEYRSMWERTFNFDHSFWSHSSGEERGGNDVAGGGSSYSSQADVHRALGEFLVDNACQGFNCSLFAYGQTGSGKTYTMLGDSSRLTSASEEGPAGLIPRMCFGLFQKFGLSDSRGDPGGATNNWQASIQVSFCEIYNEQVRDLFCEGGGSGQGLRVREHPSRGAFVEGLSARQVTCYQQVQGLLEDGMSLRTTAATAMNEVSSRSHAIFTIYVTVTFTTRLSQGSGAKEGDDGDAGVDVSSRTSKICLVDLAGSERANSTRATGDRLREAANINKSLSTLGDVIKALTRRGSTGGAGGNNSSNESFIPYRNSILTWLLKDSIGGNSKTVMLAAISPVAEAYQETMSTLRYVERAKDIVNIVAVNDASDNPLIGKLREEIKDLRGLLEKKEAAIVEHKDTEALLRATLERAHAAGDDKTSRALEAMEALEAALQEEKRKHAASAMAAADKAARMKRRNQQKLDEQAKAHGRALDEAVKRYDENLRKVVDEAEESLAEEIAQGNKKDEAAERERRLQRERKAAAELERTQSTNVYKRLMAETEQQHQNEFGLARAEESEVSRAYAATITETEAEMSLGSKRVSEIVKEQATAEARPSEQLRSPRGEIGKDKQAAGGEDPGAQGSEVAKGVTMVEELAASADIVKAVVTEATKKLRVDNEETLVTLADDQRKEARRSDDNFTGEATAASASTGGAEYNETGKKLAEDYAQGLERVATDSDGRRSVDFSKDNNEASLAIAAARADSGEVVEALRLRYEENLRARDEAYQAEMKHAVEADKLHARVELKSGTVSEIQVLKAESAANQASLEKKCREHADGLREEHEAETTRVLIGAEQRVKETSDVINEREQKAKADEAEASANYIALEARCRGEPEDARGWSREEEQRAGASENKMRADMEVAGHRTSSSVSKADVQLAAEEKKHQNLCQAKQVVKPEIVCSENVVEVIRVNDLTDAEEKYSRALHECKTEHKVVLSEVECKHQEDLAIVRASLEAEIERLIKVVEDQRVESELHAVEANRASTLSISTMEEERVAAIRSVEVQHRESLRKVEEEDKIKMDRALAEAEMRRVCDLDVLRKELETSVAQAKEHGATSISSLLRQHREELAKRVADLTDAEEKYSRALHGCKAEHKAVLSEVKGKHQEDLAIVRASLEAEIERLIKVVEDQRVKSELHAVEANRASTLSISRMEEERVVAIRSVEVQHRESLRKVEEEDKIKMDRALHREELAKRVADLTDAEEKYSRALHECKAEHKAVLSAVKGKHQEDLAIVRASLEAEIERLIKVVEDQRVESELHAVEANRASTLSISRMEEERVAAIRSLEAQHRESLRKVEEEDKIKMDRALAEVEIRRVCDLDALRKELETSLAQAKEHGAASISSLMRAHRAELAKLEEEKAEVEKQRVATVVEAEAHCVSSVETVRAKMAEDRASLEEAHRLELHLVKEKEAAKMERVSAEASKHLVAREAQVTRETSELSAKHLQGREDAATGPGVEEKEKEKAEGKEAREAFEGLRNHQREELRDIATEREAANVRAIAEDLVEEERSSGQNIVTATRNKEEVMHAAALQRERTTHVEAINNVEDALAASEREAKGLVETRQEGHQNARYRLEKAHSASLEELGDPRHQEMEKMKRRVDAAEEEMAKAKTAAVELAIRASSLEKMLETSVGSREQELADQRCRIGQLEAFVARRESLSNEEDATITSRDGAAAATRSVQQRVIDLRDMVTRTGVGGVKVGEQETGFAAFPRLEPMEGWTTERYMEELEAVLMKSIVEAAAARQDHLEADMQHQSATRELASLKLVHAQLRKRLENTRAKLEHKSQSAARRLLNSAIRLAFGFAKRSDDFSPASPLGPSQPTSLNTTPRAITSPRTHGKQSPLSQAGRKACTQDGDTSTSRASAEGER